MYLQCSNAHRKGSLFCGVHMQNHAYGLVTAPEGPALDHLLELVAERDQALKKEHARAQNIKWWQEFKGKSVQLMAAKFLAKHTIAVDASPEDACGGKHAEESQGMEVEEKEAEKFEGVGAQEAEVVEAEKVEEKDAQEVEGKEVEEVDRREAEEVEGMEADEVDEKMEAEEAEEGEEAEDIEGRETEEVEVKEKQSVASSTKQQDVPQWLVHKRDVTKKWKDNAKKNNLINGIGINCKAIDNVVCLDCQPLLNDSYCHVLVGLLI